MLEKVSENGLAAVNNVQIHRDFEIQAGVTRIPEQVYQLPIKNIFFKYFNYMRYILGVKDKLSYPAVTICNEAALAENVEFMLNETFFLNHNVSVALRFLHEAVSVWVCHHNILKAFYEISSDLPFTRILFFNYK